MTVTLFRRAGAAMLAGLAVATAVAGCGNRTPATPPVTSVQPAPTALARAGCPVADEEFCAQALVAASGLLAGDAAAMREVTVPETFECDDLPAGMVPACRPGATLTGQGVYSVTAKITLVPDPLSWLADLVGRIDPGYADDRGPGHPVVLGVGTCGPDDPDRRSYHLAFTVALRGPAGEPAQRWLGSFEFVRRDGRWVVPLVYLDTVEAWRREHRDPFRDLACGNVQPWRVTAT
jgi:hypothetical protein